MVYANAVKAAMKGKAPIVAIPVQGGAPVCVNRRRLAAWGKGIEIQRVKIEEFAPNHRLLKVEGPVSKVNGQLIGRGYIRCRASFVVIDRRTAMKELGEWADKERVKVGKKRLLGVLVADTS